MKKNLTALSVFLIITSATIAFASGPTLSAVPNPVLQGEPIMVTIDGISSIPEIYKIVFNGGALNVFLYQSKPTAFIGIDLNMKPGIYPLTASLTNGTILEKEITVLERKKVVAPLGIPEQLGGNTPASEAKLVTSLTAENAILAKLWSNNKDLWTNKFQFPVSNPIVTDGYGYLRGTGPYDIAHKGTDFKAPPGTPVMAMNRGIVRLVRQFYVYGNTIIIDHGMGLMTFYMHLSKIDVSEGQLVQQGQIIGQSGETGYAEGPHLHVTVRINNISIDPMKFMAFFQ